MARSAASWVFAMGLIAAAILVGHFVIYMGVVVPTLPEVRSVPLWIWLAVYAPEAVAAMVAGFLAFTRRRALLWAATAACIRVALMFAFAVTLQPGHLKSFESPAFESAAGFAFWTVIYLALMSLTARSRAETFKAEGG